MLNCKIIQSVFTFQTVETQNCISGFRRFFCLHFCSFRCSLFCCSRFSPFFQSFVYTFDVYCFNWDRFNKSTLQLVNYKFRLRRFTSVNVFIELISCNVLTSQFCCSAVDARVTVSTRTKLYSFDKFGL